MRMLPLRFAALLVMLFAVASMFASPVVAGEVDVVVLEDSGGEVSTVAVDAAVVVPFDRVEHGVTFLDTPALAFPRDLEVSLASAAPTKRGGAVTGIGHSIEYGGVGFD